MQTYKIIASDLDGTLLQNDMTLSAENADAITAIANRGIQFVPASGRTLCEMPQDVIGHPAIRYVIYSNGAAIWDKHTDTHTHLCMPKQVSNFVLDTLFRCACHITVRQSGQSYADAFGHSEADYSYYQICKPHHDVLEAHATFIEAFKEFIYDLDNVESIAVFFHDDKDIEICRNALLQNKELSVALSFPHCIEIFSAHGGKGCALRCLSEMLSVPIEQTITIGDSGNDVAMTKVAGLGLATANAYDDLKTVADEVICANTEHVAKYVLEHYL